MPRNVRLERLLDRLRDEKWDAMVCALPSNVLMMSGYWPVIGTGVAVASADDGVTLLIPEDEEELTNHSWAAEVKTFRPGSLDNLHTACGSMRLPLSNILSGCKRIGYEAGAVSEPVSYVGMHLYSQAMHWLLESAAAAEAKVFPADTALAELRAIKTSREIDCIRKSAHRAASGFEHGASSLKPGQTEREAALAFESVLTSSEEAERAGGHVSCMSGARSAKAYGAFARSTGKRIAEGDLVLTHCNSQVDGYWTDITRTFATSDLSGKNKEMYEALFAARDAAFAAIAPGVAAREVDAAARGVMEERGFGEAFKHSTGHGIGFGAIDAHALPRLHPKSPDRIQAGMVFNVEPGIYIDDFGGMRQCEMVAVTDKGMELLTPFQSGIESLRR